MSHVCEAALITCEDFRLHQRKDGRNFIAGFILSEKIDCDLITRGGAIQDIVRPKSEGFKDSMLRDSEVSAKLHKVKKVYLVHHEDCGAYGGSSVFENREIERQKHIADMREAAEVIKKEFSPIEVLLYYAELKDGSDNDFVMTKI